MSAKVSKKRTVDCRLPKKDEITDVDENQLVTCKKSKRNRGVQNSIQTAKHKHSCCSANTRLKENFMENLYDRS
jgi:hypothetical protein